MDLFPVWIYFKNNITLTTDLLLEWEQYYFEPLAIKVQPGKYFYAQFNPILQTDASKKLSGKASFQWGSYYKGSKTESDFLLRIAPSPHIAFTAEHQPVRIANLGIDKTDISYHITTIGTRLAANPHLQASIFYQYNSYIKQGRWNIRGSWEFAPLSFVYVVFNDNNFESTGDNTQSFINKITYIKQF